MRARRAFLWTGLALVLLLSGCARTVYEETPEVVPEATATPTPTPITFFELSPSSVSDLPPSLYLEPSVVNLTVGETATVNVWLDGAQRLNSVLLELSFDPDYVQVEDADPTAEGTQITPGDIAQPVHVVQNQVVLEEGGRVLYQVNLEPGAAVDGSGVVASLTLRGVTEGGSPLCFESIAGFDPEGNPLDLAPLSDGLITVAGQPTAQPTIQPTIQSTTQPATQPTVQPTTQPTAGGIYYVVQPGENLFRVGLKFGTTAEAIAAASNIADPNQVPAGSMVLVPVPPPQGRYGYYVQPRDTVYSIARRFGMRVEDLATLNGIGSDFRIAVGQILVVTP